MGVYPMLRDETCFFLAADFDKATWQQDAGAFLETCQQMNVPAVARPGPFQGSGHAHLAACLQECACILLPRCFVKIGGQKETGLIPKHRIDAHDEFPTLVVLAAQVPTNYFVGNGKKVLVRTFGALDSRFLADSPDPLIAAGWRIASSACLTAFEALRINILSSMKQRAEESNFGLGG